MNKSYMCSLYNHDECRYFSSVILAAYSSLDRTTMTPFDSEIVEHFGGLSKMSEAELEEFKASFRAARIMNCRKGGYTTGVMRTEASLLFHWLTSSGEMTPDEALDEIETVLSPEHRALYEGCLDGASKGGDTTGAMRTEASLLFHLLTTIGEMTRDEAMDEIETILSPAHRAVYEGTKLGAARGGDEKAHRDALKAFDDRKDMFLIRCNYHGTEAKGCDGKSYTVGHYDTQATNCFKYSCSLCTGHTRWEKIGNRCLTKEEINTVFKMKKVDASLEDVIAALDIETEEHTCDMVCCDKPATLVTLRGRGGSRYLCNDEKCRNRCEWAEHDDSGVLKRCKKDRNAPGRFCGSEGKSCAGLFKKLRTTQYGKAFFREAFKNSKDVKKR